MLSILPASLILPAEQRQRPFASLKVIDAIVIGVRRGARVASSPDGLARVLELTFPAARAASAPRRVTFYALLQQRPLLLLAQNLASVVAEAAGYAGLILF